MLTGEKMKMKMKNCSWENDNHENITVVAYRPTSNSIASDKKIFCKLVWYWVNDIYVH